MNSPAMLRSVRQGTAPMASRQSKTDPKKALFPEKRPRGAAYALGMVLIAATFAAYFPAIHAGYLWDDDALLRQNALIHDPHGLYKFWFTTEAPDYWPLSATTFWIEWRIWGDTPPPYHVMNIALHALAAVLLWRVAKRLGLGTLGAFLAGLFFAIHPVNVESVAWISERKNVLSMVFYLFLILAYLRFDDERRGQWYLLALLAAAAALLAKTSVVMLPFVLLLAVWWRRGAIGKWDVLRITPFLLLSLSLGLVTLWLQHGDDAARPEGLASRIASVGWVVWFYLYKAVLPINLALIYPRWVIEGGRAFAPLVLLIAAFVVLWRDRNGWARGPLAALASFLIVLTPVLGLLGMWYARYSLVADHLQYPGMPGLMVLLGGGLAAAWSWVRRTQNRGWAAGMAALIGTIVLAPAVLTWRQAELYRDQESIWTHTLRLNARAWAAYTNRGNAYNDKGDYDLAIQDYTKAIELTPDDAEAYYNRGNAYALKGACDPAIQDLTKAIRLRPRYAKAYNNRGNVFGRKGALDLAIQDYSNAIEFEPDYAEAYDNRGNAYNDKGDYDLAVRDYDKAIELKPGFAQAYSNRGNFYDAKGDYDLAVQDYSRAIALQPDCAEAYYNRCNAHNRKGAFDLAIQDCSKAIELKPDYAKAYNDRGTAYGQTGAYELAVQDYSKVIELRPDYAEAYSNRGNAYAGKCAFDLAIRDLTKAIRLKPDYAECYYNRGNAYGAKGDHDLALRDYTRAIELKPAYPEAYHNRAVTCYYLKKYDQAWADVKTCRQLGGTPHSEFVKKLIEASGRTE